MSQSDAAFLNRALARPAGDYLEAENGADKKFLLAIAMHNDFTEGVAILQDKFNITPEECQELLENIKFPLTESLLIAAIHLISPLELEGLLNGQDASFDPSLNDDAILKALVHAVHHRKMAHVKVLFNCQYIKPYFSSSDGYGFVPYIECSCTNFGDISFVEFLIEKRPENTLFFLNMFREFLEICHETYALFELHATAPEFFNPILHDQQNTAFVVWQVKPEELFIMLQDCSPKILPSISDESWSLFANTRYNSDVVGRVIDKYYHEENLSVSARAYWE